MAKEVIIKERLFYLTLITILLSILSIPKGNPKGFETIRGEDNAIYIQVVKDGRDEGVYAFPVLDRQITLKDIYREMGLYGMGEGNEPLVSGSKVVIQGGEAYVRPMDGKKRILFGMPIDINTAGIEDLKALPGIGEKLAIRIIKRREEIGGFHTLEDLKSVKGIGRKKIDAISNLITFDGTIP